MTKILFASLALMLLAAGHALGQTQDVHLQHGLELFRQQQFEPALQEFEQAGRTHPSSAEIENLLGITETALNQIPQAEAHYSRAIALNPKLPGPHKNLGFNDLGAKRYPAAERELKIALALDPSDLFIHYYLASLYLATSRDREAAGQYDKSGALFANDPEGEFLMAKACLNTGHSSQALELIKALVDQQQLTLSQDYELAVLLTRKRMYPEAVSRFEYALAAQPLSWIASYNLAIAWFNAGQADKALSLLKPLSLSQPDNAAILSSLGLAYESADQLPQALVAYQAAVRADPQNPDRYLDYTRLLMDLDRNDEATKIIEQGIQDSQDAYALDLRLGVLCMKQGKYEDARVALNRAIALHPELVVAYVALAQSFMQQGRDDGALPPLLEARKVLSRDGTLEYYIGLVSLRLGKDAEAEAALKDAIQLRPEVVEPHYQLGKLYLQLSKLPEAKTEFETVLRLAPEHSNAHYQLSKIYARLGETEKSHQLADETRRLMQARRESAIRLQKTRVTDFQPPPSE